MENLPQKSAPAKQELQLLKTGDLKHALEGDKIGFVPLERLQEVLRLVMLKIGMRAANFPNPEETAVLISHIQSNYYGHTTKEVVLAFDMAITDKLEVDVNCYENFSCSYFSSIMNAFRKWSSEQVKQIPTALPDMLLKNSITTQEEKLADIAEWESRQEFKMHLIPPYIYDYLLEFGKINPTTEEKWDCFARAVDVRLLELAGDNRPDPKYYEFKKMKEEKKFTEVEANILKNMAKKIAVFDFLVKRIKQD